MAGVEDADEIDPTPYPVRYDPDADEWVDPGDEDEDNEPFEDDYSEDDEDES